jgi:transposase-like protein
VHTEDGSLRIEVPRDREGSFEPLLIGKHERRVTGFDDKTVAMYARGMTVREIHDILIAVTDGLKGIGEALGAVFPATTLQTCIVHLTRNSLDYASWKDRKLLAAARKPVYTAPSAEAAAQALDMVCRGRAFRRGKQG